MIVGLCFTVLFRWVESLEEINTLLYPCLVSEHTTACHYGNGTTISQNVSAL